MTTLQQHPVKLAVEEIGDILFLADKFSDKASDFCAWLSAHATAEKDRRIAADHGTEFLEPELPKPDALKWSDTQLVNGLWVCFTISRILRDKPQASALMDETMNALVLWARDRFRDPNEPDVLAHQHVGASTR